MRRFRKGRVDSNATCSIVQYELLHHLSGSECADAPGRCSDDDAQALLGMLMMLSGVMIYAVFHERADSRAAMASPGRG